MGLRLYYGNTCINLTTNEEAWSNCSVLLHVAPPLLFTATSFLAMPTNSLAVPSPSLRLYQCNKRDMRNLVSKVSQLFLYHYVLFQPAQLFTYGNNWYLFPNCWNRQICHAHWAFKLPLCTLSGKLQTFSTVKIKDYWISIQQYTSVLFG